MEYPYKVEYLKINNAVCGNRSCRQRIQKGYFAIAAMIQSFRHDGKDPVWYHNACFFNSIHPRSTNEFEFYENLRFEDQQMIKSNVEKCTAVLVPSNGQKEEKGKKRSAPKMGPISDFGVENAKSGRSQCVGCRNKIMKDEVRVKKVVYHTEIGMKYGGQPFWHHLQCFAEIRGDYGYFIEGEKLPGYKTLIADDKALVDEALPAVNIDLKKAKKRKVGAQTELEPTTSKSVEATMATQTTELFKMRDEIQKVFKMKDLKAILKLNGSGFANDLDALLDRCADFMTFGAIDKCTKCKKGDLMFSKFGYACNGMENEWVECSNIETKPLRKTCKLPKGLKVLFPEFKSKTVDRVIRPVVAQAIDPAKEDDEKRRVKVQRKREPLYNMHVVPIGKLSSDRATLKKKIEKMGGKLVTKLQPMIAVVISTESEVEKMSKRMSEVESLDIQVVDEKFLDAIEGCSPLETMDKIKSMAICDWGSDPMLRMPPEEIKGPRELPNTLRAETATQITLKNGAAVDGQTGLTDVAHVYKREGIIYSSVLALTDIKKNKNSYCKLQVIQSDSGNHFWFFRSSGRIGTKIGEHFTSPYMSAQLAVGAFEDHYQQQTGNVWNAVEGFKKVPGKFYPLDVDYESDMNAKKIDESSAIPSKLPPQVQDLVKLIFDMDLMRQAMASFELDLEKMPLGKLSKKQLQEAYQVLTDLGNLVSTGGSNAAFVGLSNKFFTLVPHNFGLRKAPLIDTLEMIKNKREMVDSLLEIEVAYAMLQADVDENVNPIDARYHQLKTEVAPLNHEGDEFKLIEKYVNNTHASTHSQYKLEIEDVFKVKRKGEKKRYKPFKSLHNRQLLWHGSRLTNYVGILSNGLKIAPPNAPVTGYMFGKGLYFADMVSKSANYCATTPQSNTGLMLLSEVALGDMHQLTRAEFITKLPEGKHSTMGMGKTSPDPTMAVTRDDGVVVPIGTPVDDEALRSSLLYNEYIVYDVDQVNIQYLLKMKFNFKP